MKYKVEIIEAVLYPYAVEANSVEEAKTKVSDMYRNGTLPFPEDQEEPVSCEWGDVVPLSVEDDGKFYEIR